MMGKSEALATIWEVPDDLWEQIHPVILELAPPKATRTEAGSSQANPGRHHIPHTHRLPLEPPAPGTGGRQHRSRTFQRWVELGVL